MSKTALVISGGGCKGAFAVGVLKQLFQRTPQLRFDILAGTSTGSLVAPLAAANKIEMLEELYTTVTTDNIITQYNVGNRFLFNDSLFGVQPLANLIMKYYTDDFFDELVHLPQAVYLATTCLQTAESVYFSTKAPPANIDYNIRQVENADHFRRAVLASACQPVFMPPQEVFPGEQPKRQYVDGGVREYAGIQLAIACGADEVLVILLSAAANEPEEKNYDKVFDILSRTIDIFTLDVGVNDVEFPELYNSALNYLAAVKTKMLQDNIAENKITGYLNIAGNQFTDKRPVQLHIIRPDAPLGGGPGGLTFDPQEMKDMLAKGETSMQNYIATLTPGSSALV